MSTFQAPARRTVPLACEARVLHHLDPCFLEAGDQGCDLAVESLAGLALPAHGIDAGSLGPLRQGLRDPAETNACRLCQLWANVRLSDSTMACLAIP